MNSTIISSGQSLPDVSIQELGTVAALFDLADANGVAITDQLTPGQMLAVPASAAAQSSIVTYFRRRGQRLNTGDTTAPELAPAPRRYFSPPFFNPDTYA